LKDRALSFKFSLSNVSSYEMFAFKQFVNFFSHLVIVSDCAPLPLFSALVFPRVIKISMFGMKLGVQSVEKTVLNIGHCILKSSFCLMSLIIPKFHNHVFYINFVLCNKCGNKLNSAL